MTDPSFSELESALCKMRRSDLRNLVKRFAQWGERLELNIDRPSTLTATTIRDFMVQTVEKRSFQRLRSTLGAPKKMHVYFCETAEDEWTAIAAPNLKIACRTLNVPHQFGRDNMRTLRAVCDDQELIAKVKACPLVPFIGPKSNAPAEEFTPVEVEA